MTTELTPEKLEEIRQRYTSIAAPKCHICGAEMSIGAMSASRIVYACSGATYDDAGCHYAPGRSIADDHYAQSRVTVVDVSDPDVLALVEALEARDKQIAEYHSALNSLAFVARRYLPDYDEHPEIQAADKLLESAASVVVEGDTNVNNN
ncbi:ead/Ea22-like family protein [Pseudocitrobacter faecalis]|nr:ead/Ea22-like family protein [Pseudocitrobacter faecalis]